MEYQNNNIQIVSKNDDIFDTMINHIILSLTTPMTKETEQQQSQQQQPSNLMILETTLDVDTALHYKSIEWIQTLAIQQQQQLLVKSSSKATPSTPTVFNLDATWWYLCSSTIYEWHNPNIMLMKQQDYHEIGISIGRVGMRHTPSCLPSSGTTRIGLITVPATTKSSSLLRGFTSSGSSSSPLVFPSVALPPPNYNAEASSTTTTTNHRSTNKVLIRITTMYYKQYISLFTTSIIFTLCHDKSNYGNNKFV